MLTFGRLLAMPTPRLRMPVPASMISVEPSESSSSTQEVLPPYRFISGPGAGTEPRAPQTVSFIRLSSLLTSYQAYTWLTRARVVPGGPEEDHRPRLDFLGHDRQGARLDLVLLPRHRTNLELAVGWAAAPQGLGRRNLLDRHRITVLAEGADRLSPLLGRHPPGLLE